MTTAKKNTPEKMHIMAAMEEICHKTTTSHTELAELCDVSKQAMHRRFEWCRNTSVGAAAQMAEAMGYEMALIPRGADYPDGSYRVAPILADKHKLGGRR